jgi:hypothetical protein
MTFATNDPANATYVEGLAGWFQNDSERNQEPNLQATINLISDYKTELARRPAGDVPAGGELADVLRRGGSQRRLLGGDRRERVRPPVVQVPVAGAT